MNVKANQDPRTKKALLEENEQLRARLDEAEQTLDAIRSGDVDALVVAGPHGDQVFSLTGSERTYRLIVETMNEAALTIGLDGTILFCNQRFCDLVKSPMADAIGIKLATFVAPAQQRSLRMLLADTQDGPAQQQITLQATDGTAVPVLVATNLLEADASTNICLVVSDLTELEAQAGSIQYLRQQQQALEESRAALEAVNNSLSDSRRAALNVAEDALIARRLIEEANTELRREITERKRAEEALKESEERFRALTMASSDSIYRMSPDWSEMFHLDGRGFIADTEKPDRNWLQEYIHPDDQPHVKAVINEAIRTKSIFELVHRVLRVDGTLGWTFSRAIPLLDSNGKVVEWFGAASDITARKTAEEELRASEERLSLALENGRMGLWEWDTRNNHLVWNAVEYRLLGLPVGEGNEMAHLFFDRVHPDDIGPFNEIIANVMENGSDFYHEVRITRADNGQERWLAAAGRAIRDAAGQPLKMIGVNFDITERKQAEEELKKLNEGLENRVAERTAELIANAERLRIETEERVLATEALREKEQMLIQQGRQAAMGEMIGNIAHQWRQPLNTLGLTIQQLSLYHDLGEFTKELLDDSVNRSMGLIQHMSQTIDDFRNYFRPDKEKVVFKVQKAIASTLTLIEDSFKSQHIYVELVNTSDSVIHGYRNEFAQVVLNILNNARDVLTEREIKDPRVTITLGSENGRAVVTISDNAGGIPEEIIGKIFDPYFTTKGPQTGTGVGLFMSKTIIEKNMNGRLIVRNTIDGAEFRIEV